MQTKEDKIATIEKAQKEKHQKNNPKSNVANARITSPDQITKKKQSTCLLPKEQRLEVAFARSNKLMASKGLTADANGNSYSPGVSRAKYMNDPDTNEFHKIIVAHSFNECQKPIAFDSVEDFYSECQEYFTLCFEYMKVPLITGISAYMGVSPSTIYNHAGNSTSKWFAPCQNLLNVMHDINQQGAVEGQIPAAVYKYLSGNYWGMKDTTNFEVTAKQGDNVSLDEREKMIKALQDENSEQNGADY